MTPRVTPPGQPPGPPEEVGRNRPTAPFMPASGYQWAQPTQMTVDQQHQTHFYTFEQQQLQAQAATATTSCGQTPQPQGIIPNGTLGGINAAVWSTESVPWNVAWSTPQTSPSPPVQRLGVVSEQRSTTVRQVQPRGMHDYPTPPSSDLSGCTFVVLPSIHFRTIPWPPQIRLLLIPPERVQISPIAGSDLDMVLYVPFGFRTSPGHRG